MNPWVIVAILVVWIGSLAAVGKWQNTAGHTAERTVWQAKEATELAAANKQILDLETAARAAETAHATALSAISTAYEGKLKNAKDQDTADVAAVRARTIVLRDPGSRSACPAGGAVSSPAASTGGRDGSGLGELSPVASGFLLSKADSADALVSQLTACQAVVQADRAAK